MGDKVKIGSELKNTCYHVKLPFVPKV